MNNDEMPNIKLTESAMHKKVANILEQGRIDRERMELARRRSIGTMTSRYKPDKRRTNRKVVAGVISGILTTAIAMQGVGAISEHMTLDAGTSYGAQSTIENTHRTDDGANYYYDEFSMAQDLINDPANLDANVYGQYSKISFDKNGVMDHVFEYYSKLVNGHEDEYNLPSYGSFYDYCQANGILNEDGTINEDKWKDVVLNRIEANELQTNEQRNTKGK